MGKYIENIVIGQPVCPIHLIFGQEPNDYDDWLNVEKPKTYFTNDTFLPKILKDIGFVKSTSELKKNRPDLFVTLDKLDYLEIKYGKRRLFILVGE